MEPTNGARSEDERDSIPELLKRVHELDEENRMMKLSAAEFTEKAREQQEQCHTENGEGESIEGRELKDFVAEEVRRIVGRKINEVEEKHTRPVDHLARGLVRA